MARTGMFFMAWIRTEVRTGSIAFNPAMIFHFPGSGVMSVFLSLWAASAFLWALSRNGIYLEEIEIISANLKGIPKNRSVRIKSSEVVVRK